jgi:hypothetical protein
VHLIEASVEEANIPGLVDAALFSAVHDVLQSPTALDNVFGHLRPGAAVAAMGGKWPAPWQQSLYVRWHASYIRDFAGFDRPWRLLEGRLDRFHVTEVAPGSGYLVTGHVPTAG